MANSIDDDPSLVNYRRSIRGNALFQLNEDASGTAAVSPVSYGRSESRRTSPSAYNDFRDRCGGGDANYVNRTPKVPGKSNLLVCLRFSGTIMSNLTAKSSNLRPKRTKNIERKNASKAGSRRK